MRIATAIAHPNIAFIKYWGNRDNNLRLPQNGSISMNLATLYTRTSVEWVATVAQDKVYLNGTPLHGKGFRRVSDFLDLIRKMWSIDMRAKVISENNFPSGAGVASSASAFAALALAASAAAGYELDQNTLSRLARRGSGSACRSIPEGFVEWNPGTSDLDSFAVSIASPDHWPLVDVIAMVSSKHKTTSSTDGHALASSSKLQIARVEDAPRRLNICRQAIQTRDFDSLARIIELDSMMMHAVMITSSPPLFYWEPATLAVIKSIIDERQKGLPACTTIDAGPNVHVICEAGVETKVRRLVEQIPGVFQVRCSPVGGSTSLTGLE